MWESPMTPSIQPEHMVPQRMGGVSRTWCDYFYEAREDDLQDMNNSGMKIGNFLVQMPCHQKPLPDYMIQLFSPDSLGITNVAVGHYQNPMLPPLVVAGDNAQERLDTICYHLQEKLTPCKSADSLIATAYFWHFKCMKKLLRMVACTHPARVFESWQSWQRCKAFYDPADWACYCERFANLRCIIRTVSRQVGGLQLPNTPNVV